MQNKPISLLVVQLGKALYEIPHLRNATASKINKILTSRLQEIGVHFLNLFLLIFSSFNQRNHTMSFHDSLRHWLVDPANQVSDVNSLILWRNNIVPTKLRSDGDTVCNFSDSVLEPKTSRGESDVFNQFANKP